MVGPHWSNQFYTSNPLQMADHEVEHERHDQRVVRERQQRVAEHGAPHLRVRDRDIRRLEAHADREREVREVEVVGLLRARKLEAAFVVGAAAIEQVDATPMEGFKNAELDALLGLHEKGLRSVTLLPLGYRDVENDWLVNLKKVRRPKAELVIEL